MKVTDEMVRAALATSEFCDNVVTRKWMRAAIKAALDIYFKDRATKAGRLGGLAKAAKAKEAIDNAR